MRRRARSRHIVDPFANETLLRRFPPAPGGAPRVLLAAPAPYSVGMGGLSLQAVWESCLQTGLACDRAFSDFPHGETLWPRVRLRSYDLVGFSLPYELDWLALPAMLAAGGLPVWPRERRDDCPLVIAGGASVTMNPEPLSDLVDAFVIGEAEPVIPALAHVLRQEADREARLGALAALPGLYVPARPPPKPIRRLVWGGVADQPRTSLVLSPESAFPGRFLIEMGRGCPMGCRFCLVGSLYAPVRYANRDSVLRAARQALGFTRKIGLIGAALSAYPGLDGLVQELVESGADVSLSSLRADRLSPQLLQALRQGGQDTVTIAPEAGAERLRRAIGKPIADAQLAAAVAAAAECGVRVVRLYFMTNLPGETQADRAALADLVAGWAARFPTLRFAVTLSPFVPKPWTPFEEQTFPGAREVKSTLDDLAVCLRAATKAQVRPGSPRLAAVQAALSRGDRGVGRALVAAAQEGGSHAALKKALRAEGVNLDGPLMAPTDKPWLRALGGADGCAADNTGDASEGGCG